MATVTAGLGGGGGGSETGTGTVTATVTSSGCASLRRQLESERLGLQRLEKDIRRAVHRVHTQPSQQQQQQQQQHQQQHQQQQQYHFRINNDRGFSNLNNRAGPRLGNKNNFYQDGLDQQNIADDRHGKKRPHETKTVFSRLSARPIGDSDGEDETNTIKKPRISSQVIRDLPTKQDVLKAQEGDEKSKARNRRMFGSLLGTLQKFKQEAIVLQNKEDKKAQVEKKIEEQAKQEKENQKKERQNLYASREIKKATIKALESKMVRMREFEKWEAAYTTMLGFIQTKGKPQVFWKPKKMTDEAQEKLNNSKKLLEKTIEKKRHDVQIELNAIEQRCLRNIRLPPDARPTSLSDTLDSVNMSYNESMDTEEQDDIDLDEDRVHGGSLIIKVEKDEKSGRTKSEIRSSIQIKQEKRDIETKIENGKSQPSEKWNREDSDSSSDENEENGDGADKDHHSTDELSHPVEKEDPGGSNKENPDNEESSSKSDEDVPAEKMDDTVLES